MCPCGTIDLHSPDSNPCPNNYTDPIPCKKSFDNKYVGDYE